MEFFEGFLSSQQSNRLNKLTLKFTPERSCWASLPPAVISQIYALGFEVPLVLQLQLSHPSVAQFSRYVAWAGAGSAGGLTLEMSTALGQSLGVEEGHVLQVQALPDVPLATSVTLEPADADDWEILEHNAEYLEQHLLNQVGVVCQGQSFPFWVHQHSVIRLRATSTSPAHVVRLGRGVELLVAPKPRRSSVHVPDVDMGITPSPHALTPMKPPLLKEQPKTPKAAEAPTRMAILRVTDACSSKWLLPLVGVSHPTASASCTPQPPSSAQSWLTTAAVVAPETAMSAQLAPGYPVLLRAKPGHPIKQVAVMLLIDPGICPGHIMLTPPLQQATGALPHTHIKLLQPVVQPVLLPSVPPTSLHPVGLDSSTVSDIRLTAAAIDASTPAGADTTGNMNRATKEADETSAALQLALSESIHSAFCGCLQAQLAAIQAASTTLETWLRTSNHHMLHLPFGNMQPQTATAATLAAVPLATGSILHITTGTDTPSSRAGRLAAQHPPQEAHARNRRAPGVDYTSGVSSSTMAPQQQPQGAHAGEPRAPGAGHVSEVSSSRLPPQPAGRVSGDSRNPQLWPTIDGCVPPHRACSAEGPQVVERSPGSLDVLAGLGVRELCDWDGGGRVEQCFLVQLQGSPAVSAGASSSGQFISMVTAATLKQQQRNKERSPTGTAVATQLKPPVALTQTRYPSAQHEGFLHHASKPPPPLADVNWLHAPLSSCVQRVCAVTGTVPWGPRPWPSQVPRPGGLLVSAASGAGKTLLMRELGWLVRRHPCHQVHVLHVECKRLAGNTPAKMNKVLHSAFVEAQQCWPSLVVLDDLDLLCPAASDGPEAAVPGTSAALANWLATVLDVCSTQAELVACAATVSNASSLSAVLRCAGRLDMEVALPTPGAAGRSDMLAAVLKQHGCCIPLDELQVIVDRAEGYDASDMQTLVQRAMHVALARHISGTATGQLLLADGAGLHLSVHDLESALAGFEPTAFWGLQATKGASEQELSGWEDVGGLPEVREVLYEALELPLKFPNLVAAAPLRLRTGLLLYGPPGCGKTHVVNAAIAATGARFISVKGPELLNKYIGASEAAIRAVFQRAAAAAPCVLFFDEMDSIAPPRGHDSTGVTDRVVNQLLTELDGVEGLKGVCVIGATSRPDLIDAALLRPGRLDRQVYCGFPDRLARLQILRALSRKLSQAADVDLEWVASHSNGFTGADLGAVFSSAQLSAVHRVLAVQSTAASHASTAKPGTAIIGMTDIEAAFESTRPSVPVSERQRLEAIYQRFQKLQDPKATPDVKGKGKRVTLA